MRQREATAAEVDQVIARVRGFEPVIYLGNVADLPATIENTRGHVPTLVHIKEPTVAIDNLGHALSETDPAYRCPTLCDPACRALCHEAHAHPRTHDPRVCVAVQR